MKQKVNPYENAARAAVDLANRLADKDSDADVWDIADGLLAGIIHYWLYSRQPCGEPDCADCEPISTAQARLAELLHLTEQLALDSDYYHSPHDINVGRA